MNISQKLRRDIKEIASRHMQGDSLSVIAKEYGCSYKLVGRIMKQLLPVTYFTHKAQKQVVEEKRKLKTRLPRKRERDSKPKNDK